jgi:hypothetical protein
MRLIWRLVFDAIEDVISHFVIDGAWHRENLNLFPPFYLHQILTGFGFNVKRVKYCRGVIDVIDGLCGCSVDVLLPLVTSIHFTQCTS